MTDIRIGASGPLSNQYWTFQIAGWSAMALLSYLSLTIWYNPGQLAPAAHTVLQSLLGIVVSHPLRWVATRTWQMPLARRALINGGAVFIASMVWTQLRIESFTWLTGEAIPTEDWGGWIFASVIVFGAWAFCYHALKYYRQSSQERRLASEAQNEALIASARAQQESFKRLEAEKLFREAQLRMLKYQLNPHFLLNALNSASALVQKGDREAAMDMLARIGNFLSASLAHPEEVQHTLAEELDDLDTYLSIEKVRFGERLRTQFDIDPDARDIMVPSLLLQPLFENAIKFAVGARIAPTLISFQARLVGRELRLRLSDDGPGMDESELENSESSWGIGMMNVRQRLESAFGEGFTFQLSQAEPSGLVIEITLSDARQPAMAGTTQAEPMTQET
jgi:two-component system, LytTR family, sensor kinase